MCTVLAEIHLAPGTLADYRALSRWHYRRGMPAAATRVLVAWHVRGPRRRRAGVIVEAMPTLASSSRDAATAGRYRAASSALADRRRAAAMINADLRVISRVVVHPTFRGIGVGVMLVRALLASAVTPHIEAHAAMGAVNPFFEHAGMTAHTNAATETIYYFWSRPASA